MRGQVYEALGEKALATHDCRKVQELLPPEDLMIDGVREALSRVA